MTLLTLNFDTSSEATGQAKTASAAIQLSVEQLGNFFTLREIARAKAMAYVEIYMHGVKCTCESMPLETGDFVVNTSRGVALKAFTQNRNDKMFLSEWLSWTTLEALKQHAEVEHDIHTV